MKCENCDKEAIMEISNTYTNGEKTTKHYCNERGKNEFRNLFREMYGLPPKQEM